MKLNPEQLRQQLLRKFWGQAVAQSLQQEESETENNLYDVPEPIYDDINQEELKHEAYPDLPTNTIAILAEDEIVPIGPAPDVKESETENNQYDVPEPIYDDINQEELKHEAYPNLPTNTIAILAEDEIMPIGPAPDVFEEITDYPDIIEQPEILNIDLAKEEHLPPTQALVEDHVIDSVVPENPDAQLFDKIITPLMAAAGAAELVQEEQPVSPKPQADPNTAFIKYLTEFAAKEKDIKTATPKVENVLSTSEPDTSIIDIAPEVRPIVYEENTVTLTKYVPGIPHWKHHYVYQASEINYADENQQAFYRYFKDAFLNGTYLDLEGNTNYGFILYFDLIKSYTAHQDLKLLERQFELLQNICPKVSAYGRSYLVAKMREFGDHTGAARIQGYWTSPSYNRPDYLMWDWRNRFEKKMELTKQEAELLVPISLSANNFLNIEFCFKNVVRLYLELVKILKNNYRLNGTSIQIEFPLILDIVARKQNRYHLGSANYEYTVKHDQPLYQYIFRYAENALRDHYRHSRKIVVEGYYTHDEVKAILAEKINKFLDAEITNLLQQTESPDGPTEIELNAISPARWRINIDAIIQEYTDAKDSEIIERLIRLNDKNPSKDLLLYELSRQLIPIDKALAMQYYFRHVYQAKQDKTRVWKLPTATMLKQLFKTPQESLKFHNYLNEYVNEPDLENAIVFAKDYFLPVRKKIDLDSQTIRQAQEQDAQTSELLSVYLADDEESLQHQNSNTEKEYELPEAKNLQHTIQTLVVLPPASIALLELFQAHDLTLSLADTEAFCKTQGTMAGTLINNINEACYDLLDENLIENQQTQYSILPEYFHQIVNA